MFEQLTDRARKVMALARQEAARFHHAEISVEHVLLGLVKEGTGTACNVLERLKVDRRRVRIELEKSMQPGTNSGSGQRPPSAETQRLITEALEVSRTLAQNYIGTEHLLIAILRHGPSPAAEALRMLGVTHDCAQAALLDQLHDRPAEGEVPVHTDGLTMEEIEELSCTSPRGSDTLVELFGLFGRELAERKERAMRDADYERADGLRDVEEAVREVRRRLWR